MIRVFLKYKRPSAVSGPQGVAAMKGRLACAAAMMLFAAALGGCTTGHHGDTAPDGKTIKFTPAVNAPQEKAASRAAVGHPIESGVNIPAGGSFGAYAYSQLTTGGVVDPYAPLRNMQVTSDGTDFNYVPVAKWPIQTGAKLAFYGYYPWQDQTASPAAGDPVIGVTAGGQNAPRMTINYTTPADPSKQVDLMYAYTGFKTGFDPVEMRFGHALARVNFKAQVTDYVDPVVITSITVTGVQTRGTLTVIDANTPLWGALAAPADMSLTPSNGLRPGYQLTGTPAPAIDPGGDMLVIPQPVQTLEVRVEATLDGTPFPEPFVFALSGSPDWEMNRITTYQITISGSGMKLEARMDGWNPNGVTVIQDGQGWMTVGKDRFEFAKTGGTETLAAETNYYIASQGFLRGLQVDAAVDPSKIEYTPALGQNEPGWLTLGLSNPVNSLTQDITLTAAANTGVAPRKAKFSVRAGNFSKTIEVAQTHITGAPRLYVLPNAGDPRLEITRDPANYGTLFQYGGVVAWNYNNTGAADYNPTNNSALSTWNTSWSVGNRNVPHSNASLRLGQGDPCRLAGYAASYVKSEVAVGRTPDNGDWRLPTHAENVSFAAGGSTWQYANGGIPGGRIFSSTGEFLPAGGFRDVNDRYFYRGEDGNYWSSSPSGATSGHFLYFTEVAASSQTINNQATGLSVRCVRQTASVVTAAAVTPGGNIPSGGMAVTFSITGTYRAGQVQVRVWNSTANSALAGPASIASGQIASTGTQMLAVPANTATASRSLAMQYLDPATGLWVTIVQVSQEGVSFVDEPGDAAPRIYVKGTGADAKLMLTQNPANYGTLFQYGGVVAWNYGNTGTTVASADFNITSIVGWSGSWYIGNVDVPHTDGTLKTGIGDPCRLVGMTKGEIQTALNAGQTPDNGQWRLPTTAENVSFAASSSDQVQNNGVYGRWFDPGNTSGSFLPAAGSRFPNGGYYGKDAMGYYWSGSPFSSAAGYLLTFQSGAVTPQAANNQATGYSVRCVRQ